MRFSSSLIGSRSGSLAACFRLGSRTSHQEQELTNWGKKSGGPDCFVMAMITADPTSGVYKVTDTGIEECIAINPASGNVGPATVFHAGPKDDSGTNAEAWPNAPVARRDAGQRPGH